MHSTGFASLVWKCKSHETWSPLINLFMISLAELVKQPARVFWDDQLDEIIATALASCLCQIANKLAAMLCDQQIISSKFILDIFLVFVFFGSPPFPTPHRPPTQVTGHTVRGQDGTVCWILKTVLTCRAAAASQQCPHAKLQQHHNKKQVWHRHQHQRGVYFKNHLQ